MTRKPTMRGSAFFACLALGLVAYLLACAPPAGATTHPAAAATAACINGQAVATFTYSGFSPKNHLTATEALSVTPSGSGSATFSFDGPGATHTLRVALVGAGPFSLRATSSVVAGGGRVKATAEAEATCRQPSPPPPPPDARYDPRAWAQGPCGDPMYRFWFDNRRSNRPVTFRVSYLNYDSGWTTFTREVARKAIARTAYHHVTGSSLMTIRARGRTLYSRISAPGGNYPACPA